MTWRCQLPAQGIMRSARRHARSRLYLHPGPVSRDHRGNGCGDQRHLTTPGRAMSLHKPGGAASGLPTGESMMVPMRPVHMAVGQFFAGGGAHLGHGQAEAQGLPGPGVVAV